MAKTPTKSKGPDAAPEMDNNWHAEDDHRTMMRAAEVMADKKRLAGVHKHQQKQIGALGSLGRMLAAKKLDGKLKK